LNTCSIKKLKKILIKKLTRTKNIATKRIRIIFDRKKIKEDEIVRKN
jgi:hypothetical protein